jgi:hypothetical protein
MEGGNIPDLQKSKSGETMKSKKILPNFLPANLTKK